MSQRFNSKPHSPAKQMRNLGATIQQSRSDGIDSAIGQIDLLGNSGDVVKSWRIRSPRCTVGTGVDCSVQLAASGILALHATLIFGKKHTLLRSSGPTLINNRHVREWLIDHSTEIVIGNARLVVHPSIGVLATVVQADHLIEQASKLCREPSPSIAPISFPSVQDPSPPLGSPDQANTALSETNASLDSPVPSINQVSLAKLDSIERHLESLQLSLEKMQQSLGSDSKNSSESIVESVSQEIDEFGKKLFTNLNDQLSNQTGVQTSLISNLADQFANRFGAIDEQLNRFGETTDRQGNTLAELLSQASSEQASIDAKFQEVISHRNELIDAVQVLREEIAAASKWSMEQSQVANNSPSVLPPSTLDSNCSVVGMEAIHPELSSSFSSNVSEQSFDPNWAAAGQLVQQNTHAVTDEQLAYSLEKAQIQIRELNSQLRSLEIERDTAQSRIAALSQSLPTEQGSFEPSQPDNGQITANSYFSAEQNVSEEPIAEQQFTEQQYAEQPYAEQPYAEQPYAEQPYAEQQYAEQPYAEQPYAEQQYAEQQYAEQQYAEQQYAEQQYAEQQYAEQQYAEQQYAEQPYAEQPYAEQPYAEQPYAEQPYAEQQYAEQPYAEQPYAEQPYAEQPYAEQPYAEQLAPQQPAESPARETSQNRFQPVKVSRQIEQVADNDALRGALDEESRQESRQLPAWFTQGEDESLTQAPVAIEQHVTRSDSQPQLSSYSYIDAELAAETTELQDAAYDSPSANLDSISERLQRMLADAGQRRGPANPSSELGKSSSWSQKYSNPISEGVKTRAGTSLNRPPESDSAAASSVYGDDEQDSLASVDSANNPDEQDLPSSLMDLYRQEPSDMPEVQLHNTTALESYQDSTTSESIEDSYIPSEMPGSKPTREVATPSYQSDEIDSNQGAGEGSEEEDSIEQYMQRLLNRVRGGSEAESGSRPTVAQPVAATQPKPTATSDASKPRSKVAASLGIDADDVTPLPLVEKLNEELFVPRQQAPEQRNDLAALRELANTNARRAISRSDIRRTNSAFLLKLGITALAISSAIALFLFNGFAMNAPFAGMVAAIIVSFLWGYDCVTHFKRLQKGMIKVTADETAAGQSIRVSSDDGGWRPTPA